MERRIFDRTRDVGKSLFESVREYPEQVPTAVGGGTFLFANQEAGLAIIFASVLTYGVRKSIIRYRNRQEKRD